MIKKNDILHAITTTLKKKFNYKNSIKENEQEVKEPSFFVSLKPLKSNTYKYWNEKSINIYITYTNYNAQQEELLDMEDSLDELFDMYITVNDTSGKKYSLVFNDKKFDIKDGFMTMKLSTEIMDNKTTVSPEDASSSLMENLNLDIN